MAPKTVALEESLSRFRTALEEAGFSVVEVPNLEATNWPDADLALISGQDKDMMGRQEISTSASVINVKGLTAEQIVDLAKERLE